jgi:hypothetical protein
MAAGNSSTAAMISMPGFVQLVLMLIEAPALD